MRHLLAAAVLTFATPVTFAEANWPQWRGPDWTGEAKQADPPVEWSETKNVKWKVRIPGGHGNSTPVIWGDRIYVQTAVPAKGEAAAAAPTAQPAGGGGGGRPGGRRPGGGGGMSTPAPTEPYKFVIMALDKSTGKTVWEKTAAEVVPHEGHHRDHGFASFSPATDGKRLIVLFGSRGLYGYDMDGNLKWSKDLGKQQTRNSFGEGTSPVLHKDTVIVNWDHEGADFIAAFDADTGAEKWRTPRDEATTWVTPLVVEHAGQTQVIVSATNKIRSYDLATGKQIWECGGMTANVIPTPVHADGVVYVTSGFRGSNLLAIKLGKTGDLTGTDAILWSAKKGTPYVPSPLLSGNRLYFFQGNEARLSCYDVKTGKPLYEAERIEDLQGVYASPVAAGGRVYLVGRNGVTVVIKDADKVEVLATNTLTDRIDASPAVVGNEIFLRGKDHLYCIGAK
ncbi:MAG TPA: PQQ-binding-like beta-propeller repeat protein [Tepidisphaeraceae bacterium]|nr:PQQ-binding-like beta-propeller repeat protein [Tepidisphaeraceae bacterium]